MPVMRNGRVRRLPQTVCIVQARMGSARLPGKVLMDIGNRPMLRHVVERIETVKDIDRVVVATSTEPEDQAIIDYCQKVLEIDVAAVDDVNDVLGRFMAVAEAAHATTIVRVTADCPLLDPEVVVRALESFARGADYASNVFPRSFPDGLDVEVFSVQLLRKLNRVCQAPLEREHVTLRVHQRPNEAGIIRNLQYEPDLSALRWTVDTAEDLEFVRDVYRHFAPRTLFSWREVLDYAPAAARKVA